MAYGDAMLDGSGPFSMEEALAKQQASGQTPEQEDMDKQVLEKLKAKTDAIGNSNKVKELSLKLMEEMQKSQELEARMQEHPEVLDLVDQLLSEEEGGQPVEQPQPTQEPIQ
jgi:hypothetical protein